LVESFIISSFRPSVTLLLSFYFAEFNPFLLLEDCFCFFFFFESGSKLVAEKIELSVFFCVDFKAIEFGGHPTGSFIPPLAVVIAFAKRTLRSR